MPRPLFICIPTRDGRSVTLTTATVYAVALALKREPTFIIGETGNISRSRNVCMEILRRYNPGRTSAWAWWIDSDIYIPAMFASAMAETIQEAELRHRNYAVNYQQSNRQNALFKSRAYYQAEHYTDQELLDLPHGAEIGMCGLGCVYMLTPLTYIWHSGEAGEDIAFWIDNPDVKVHYARNVGAIHKRQVDLMPVQTW
jgi:hypothetical protein